MYILPFLYFISVIPMLQSLRIALDITIPVTQRVREGYPDNMSRKTVIP